jgi:LuxR family maltose regulon positive regulatory protein
LFLTGHFGAAERRLNDAEAAPDFDSVQRGAAAGLRSTLAASLGDLPRTIELAHEALANISPDDFVLRGIVAMNLGVAYFTTGESAAAQLALAEAVTLGEKAQNNQAVLVAIRRLGQLAAIQGNLRKAMALYQTRMPPASRSRLPVDGYIYLGLGELYYEWNQLEDAQRNVDEAMALGQWGGNIDILVSGCVIQAKIKWAQGDQAGALAVLEAAMSQAEQHRQAEGILTYLGAQRVRFWLASRTSGAMILASRWADGLSLAALAEVSISNITQHISCLLVHLAEGKADDALVRLERLVDEIEARGWQAFLIEALAIMAIIRRGQGDDDGALTALERAWVLAQPGGFVRTFIDLGEPLRLLIADLQPKIKNGTLQLTKIRTDDIDRLLQAFVPAKSEPGNKPQNQPQPVNLHETRSPQRQTLVEPLSERELEVLHLIVNGLSNQEIADRLTVSLATVKTHINNLYGKLGIKTRVQAATKAHELGLL